MTLLIVLAAKYLVVLPILLAAWCIYALRGAKRRELILLSIISLPLAYILAFIAGKLWYDPRPFVVGHFTPLVAHAANNGFPSDHMLLAATVAMIGWYLSRRLGTILWILALIVGLARVAAGVHHIVDIFGSALIAIVAVSAVWYLLRRFIHFRARL
jgi:undecaprenyl-diphosphatase